MPSILSLPRFCIVNSAGVPYPNAKAYTYRAGTTTPLTTYTTQSLFTPHPNPVVADANGLFPAIYFDESSGYDMRVIFKTSADVTIFDEDGIPRSQSSFGDIFPISVVASGYLQTAVRVRTPKVEVYAAEPRIVLWETDAAADNGVWDVDVNANILRHRTRTDADAVGKDYLAVTRSSTAVTQMDIGNSDNPIINLNAKRLYRSLDAVKIGNSTRTSTASVSDDSELILNSIGSGYYAIDGFLLFNAASSGAQGIRFSFGFTGTANTSYYSARGAVNGGTDQFSALASSLASQTNISNISVTANADYLKIDGTLVVTVAGNFSLKWAQQSSDASATNLIAGSYLRLRQFA